MLVNPFFSLYLASKDGSAVVGGVKPWGFGLEVCSLRLSWNLLRGVSGGQGHHVGTGQPPWVETDVVEDRYSFEPWGMES